MKKLVLGLSVLLSGFAATSQASLPNSGPRCVTVPCSDCGGINFGITGLFWRADAPQQAFATTYDAIDPFNLSVSGDAHDQSNRHRHDWGFQLNAGYTFPCSGTDVNVVYTDWNKDHHKAVDKVQVIPTPGQLATFNVPTTGPALAIVSLGIPPDPTIVTFGFIPLPVLLAAPTFAFIDTSSKVFSRTDFENHTWDLNFGQAINVGCNTRVHWFGGLRYSALESKFDTAIETTFVGAPLSPTPFFPINADAGQIISTTDATITGSAILLGSLDLTVTDFLHNTSKFNGIGPRFGIDIDHEIGCGFGVVGSVATSLIVGEIDSSFAENVTLQGQFISAGSTTGLVVAGFPGPFIIAPQTANFTSDTGVIGFSHPDETRIVPNIDAKLGFDWSLQFCNCSHTRLRLEAGYMVSHYFNAVDRPSFVGFADEDFGEHRTLDMNFEGPYVSAQVKL